MTKEIRKYFEYCFFILVNIGLSAPMLKVYNFLFTVFVIKIAEILFNKNFLITNDNLYKKVFDIAESEPLIWVLTAGFCFTIILLKPFVFQILYLLENFFPYTHILLNKFRSKKYIFCILCLAFSIDIFCLVYFKDLLSPILGISLNYISFFIFFHPILKDKK